MLMKMLDSVHIINTMSVEDAPCTLSDSILLLAVELIDTQSAPLFSVLSLLMVSLGSHDSYVCLGFFRSYIWLFPNVALQTGSIVNPYCEWYSDSFMLLPALPNLRWGTGVFLNTRFEWWSCIGDKVVRTPVLSRLICRTWLKNGWEDCVAGWSHLDPVLSDLVLSKISW